MGGQDPAFLTVVLVEIYQHQLIVCFVSPYIKVITVVIVPVSAICRNYCLQNDNVL